MPNINDCFPSKYLKASDLQGHEPVVTIDRVEFEPVGRDRQMKAVLYFHGKDKGLILNKTNANKIMELTGSAVTEEWAHAQVKLYATETQYGGDTVDCIRIKAVTKPKMQTMIKKPTSAPVVTKSEWADDPDGPPFSEDEVPF